MATRGDDREHLLLDTIIALVLDIQEAAGAIAQESDEPEVVRAAIEVVKAARTIQDRAREYRPRLLALRQLVDRRELYRVEKENGRH